MTLYRYYFTMPVTGSFVSQEKDFDEALKAEFPNEAASRAKYLVALCDLYYSGQNIEPCDMPENPEIV